MPDEVVPSQGFIIGDKLYARGKWIVMILLPAFSTLYIALGALWGLPYVNQIVGTSTALAAFFGVLLGVSSKTYNNSEARFDGDMVLETDEDGKKLYSMNLNADVKHLDDKKAVTFKVVPRS